MDYADLVNDIVPECPGVPYPVVINKIREAARTFCRESAAYRKKLTPADLSYASGIYTIAVSHNDQIVTVVSPMAFLGSYAVYTFSDGSTSASPTPPAGQTLISTENYSINKADIQGASPEWLDVNRPSWRSDIASDTVDYFCMLSNNTFKLTPDNGVDRSDNLVVSVVLMPSRDSTMLQRDFGERWWDSLCYGAKALLMAMPNVEWSNPQLALYYKGKFEEGIDEARAYVATGYRRPMVDGKRHVKGYFK